MAGRLCQCCEDYQKAEAKRNRLLLNYRESCEEDSSSAKLRATYGRELHEAEGEVAVCRDELRRALRYEG